LKNFFWLFLKFFGKKFQKQPEKMFQLNINKVLTCLAILSVEKFSTLKIAVKARG